jgi:hypothetical protein
VTKEEYPILQVMDMLQDQKINSFSLVTGLRGRFLIKKTLKWLNKYRRRWRQKGGSKE